MDSDGSVSGAGSGVTGEGISPEHRRSPASGGRLIERDSEPVLRYNLPMSNLTRRDRESRAFALTMTSSGLGVASVVTFVLTVAGVASFGFFLLLLIATAVSVVALRSTMKR
jgi:hypothetical protein